MKTNRFQILAGWLTGLLAVLAPCQAQAQKVHLGAITDVSFGIVGAGTNDIVSRQNVCVASQSANASYMITARGSGAASAFELGSAAGLMPYEVQWASTADQMVGATLIPGVAIGAIDPVRRRDCNQNPAANSSLIIILRAGSVGSANAGSYAGTLTLIIAPT
jgi:hypothetical protein